MKWGRPFVMANIRKALFDMKRKLDVLFTLELLHKDDSVCFHDTGGNPITRYLVYCNDFATLVECKDLIEVEDNMFENHIGIDDGKGILKVSNSNR